MCDVCGAQPLVNTHFRLVLSPVFDFFAFLGSHRHTLCDRSMLGSVLHGELLCYLCCFVFLCVFVLFVCISLVSVAFVVLLLFVAFSLCPHAKTQHTRVAGSICVQSASPTKTPSCQRNPRRPSHTRVLSCCCSPCLCPNLCSTAGRTANALVTQGVC